ncbi:NAD(P)H-dependent oxidoreductase [Arenibacter sp. GZD96]|uniref:NAD(P)H-dependent oxidoreductase n=1 Tax=Aurantibrevibacter litoralis TaxID=3106030 RepID=UPI002AFFD28E|nr:NAD(P)H-dependent oxidoreductase [Arenibacter sp. GZD-96]MEA1786815.1 NAD(P)H-dependent oxidoreductase [Arenibacter sp. GZD-96]
MIPYISDLKWRYAVKKFDKTKKVSEADLATLLDAIQLSPSSFGLQPYEIFVISDPELRKKLMSATWGQQQVVDASHLIVFANKTTFGSEIVDDYFLNVSNTRGLPIASLSDYSNFVKSKMEVLSESDKAIWANKQVYIALGNFLSAAAALKIDTCPMEGFEPEKYNEILGLKKKRLNAAVVATIGYRSEDDQTQSHAKVRKTKEQLFTHL